MAIFDSSNTVKNLTAKQMASTLSPKQDTVARSHYKEQLRNLSTVMDINNPELKELIAKGIIERLKSFEMIEN